MYLKNLGFRPEILNARRPTAAPVRLCGVLVAVLLLSSALAAPSGGSVPNTISPPKGLNLGSTSFFDGFGRTTEGWTLLQYGRYENLTSINGPQGDPSPLFSGTHITVEVSLTQFCYTSDWHPFGGDAVGFSAALPLIDVQSSFSQASPVHLANNGFGIGDLVWGPTYQSRMYLRDGTPYFAWRTQLIIESPTGEVNRRKDISPGAGFWATNPYVTFTYLPVPKVEISNRLNYQYNFASTAFSHPPPIPGLLYRNGQAGQLVYDNFDVSYPMSPRAYLGVDGYAERQLTLDRTNGLSVPNSLVKALYLGPGARYVFGAADALNLNLYLKVISDNDTSGLKMSVQYVHRFP